MTGSLAGRRIVLGVSGGVAAYKAVELCRELVRRGAFVSPLLTASAQRFIGAATFSAVASEPARASLWDSPEPSPHTDLGQTADLVLVAPATARLVAAARAGLADDLLTTTLLATRAPVVFAPAMHTEMWEHAATRDNVATLEARGVHFVAPAAGELAGGDIGVGRLADTMTIADACEAALADLPNRTSGTSSDAPLRRPLPGTTVLVSAGGTREAIDPVRFIGNRSSGKQGHAIAMAALDRGARVRLVTTTDAPRELTDHPAVEITRVTSAAEMHDAMLERTADADIVIMAAAVADFRPADPVEHKLKRRDGLPIIRLEPTANVLGALVEHRHAGQTIVGFAAETDDLERNALGKLRSSGADLTVANDVSGPDAGFECDTNAVCIFGARANGEPVRVATSSKREVAEAIIDIVLDERATATTVAVDERPRLREVR